MTASRPVRPGVVLALACLGQFMVVLDTTVVNVGLPDLRTDLALSSSQLTWVVNAYLLTFGGLLLLGGRAGDLLGRRRLYLAGMAVFGVASLVAGLAPSGGVLIAARAVQGVGAAAMAPASLSIITATFTDPAARHRAMGIWSATAAAGGAAGLLLGGVLVQLLSWRWTLLVNVPIAALVIGLSAQRLPDQAPATPGTTRLDLPGAVTVTVGLAAVAYAILGTEYHAWGSATTLGWLAGGLGLLALFVVIEARSAAPLVPLSIFRNRTLSTANLLAIAVGTAMTGSLYLISLYLQRSQGYSPLATGAAMLPSTVLNIAGARVSSRIVTRVGPRPPLVLGLLLVAAALLWLAALPEQVSFWRDLLGPTTLLGLGLGAAVAPIAVAANTGVAPAQAGLASGLMNASRQIGGLLGLAVLTAVATHRTSGLLDRGASPLHATVAGESTAFLIAAGVALAGALVATIGLRSPRPRETAEPVAGEA